jgi:hypothetical protein
MKNLASILIGLLFLICVSVHAHANWVGGRGAIEALYSANEVEITGVGVEDWLAVFSGEISGETLER